MRTNLKSIYQGHHQKSYVQSITDKRKQFFFNNQMQIQYDPLICKLIKININKICCCKNGCDASKTTAFTSLISFLSSITSLISSTILHQIRHDPTFKNSENRGGGGVRVGREARVPEKDLIQVVIDSGKIKK